MSEVLLEAVGVGRSFRTGDGETLRAMFERSKALRDRYVIESER